MVTVRLFDGRGNVKDVKIHVDKLTKSRNNLHSQATRNNLISIHDIKQCLQAKFHILSAHTLITSPTHNTLLEDSDTVDSTNAFLIAYIKESHKPLGFRVASARARNPKYEKINVEYS